MKPSIRSIVGIVPLLFTVALASGCDAPKPQPATPVEAQPSEVSKTTAIQQAQRDAALRFAEVQVAHVDARRQGGFWVVELMSPTGSGLRYTISALDGSIRQRHTFQ